jgi:hypothetical protein
MSTFVLVHGGAHGPWCWQLLEPELAERGHEAVAVDMPVDSPTARIADYVDAVCEQLPPSLGADAILVGHSLAGRVIPHVAARQAVGALVYLCAALPELADGPVPTRARTDDGFRPDDPHRYDHDDLGRAVISVEAAIGRYYHDCAPDLARWAAGQLRPQGQGFLVDPPVVENLPAVRTHYIACADDRTSSASIAAIVPSVLGVEPLQMPGGHSPFLSRPGALAELLHLIADAARVDSP